MLPQSLVFNDTLMIFSNKNTKKTTINISKFDVVIAVKLVRRDQKIFGMVDRSC
jgi:hypothetical protein